MTGQALYVFIKRKFWPRLNKVNYLKKYICYQAWDPEYAVNCIYLTFSMYMVEDILLREKVCVKESMRVRVLKFQTMVVEIA